MSLYRITPGKVKGEIRIPPSKSHTLRAILFGAMGKGKSVILDPLFSSDTEAMMKACRMLGAKVDADTQKIKIEGLNGKIKFAEDVIHAGNSGIVLRFCSALGALASHPVVITGDESIRYQRPMQPLLEALAQLGVSAASMRGDGYAPIIVQGPIKKGTALMDGEDSQPVSALLIASAFVDGPLEIIVRNPGEKPWVGLTLNWFDRLGIPYENQGFEHYRLFGPCHYEGFEYTVPGDFSSAAFPIAAALVTQSEVLLKNVDMSDCQGDKELVSAFKKMGAAIEIDEKNKTLLVKKGGALKGLSVDINDFVDGITILAVVGCFADGETLIYNGAVARHKECNRIQCIVTELRKMGADISETEDGILVRKSMLKGAKLHSHHDHRMAMSLAVAALGAEGETTIQSVECIAKTFPSFVQDFKALQANIEVVECL